MSINLKESVVLLRVQSGPLAGRAFVVPRTVSRLGRLPDSEIHIPDPTISRDHCEVGLTSEGVWVRDHGSANGTWVNDEAVTEVLLQPGQSIRLGDLELAIEVKPLHRPRSTPLPMPASPPTNQMTMRVQPPPAILNANGPISYRSIQNEQAVKPKGKGLFSGLLGRKNSN